MKNLSDNDLNIIHNKLLELLKCFKEICDAENIWYTLVGGTLLGAIRHKGFIPWDTDVDVAIMLSDKQKFRDAFYKLNPVDFKLKDYDKEKKCLQSHDTLMFKDKQPYDDIHLDIYPFVGAPSEFKKQQKFAHNSCYMDKILRSKYSRLKEVQKKNKFFVFLIKILLFFIPTCILKKNIKKRESKYDLNKSSYLMTLANYGKATNCIPKDYYNEMVDVEFEGVIFKAPYKWHDYLVRYYGENYMTPKKY